MPREGGRSTRFSPLHPSEEATHSLRREEDRGEPFIFGYMHHKRAINTGFLSANIAIKRKTQIPYLQLLRKSQRVKPPS